MDSTLHDRPVLAVIVLTVGLTVGLAGCEPSGDERLADFATDSTARQAEQNQQMAELQKEVAQGARQLVEAENASRQQIISLQRDLQHQAAGMARQRDHLEVQRMQIARQRQTHPVIAAAIKDIGLLLACILPLVLCYFLLRHDSADDELLTSDALIEDLLSAEQALPAPAPLPRIGSSPPHDAEIGPAGPE